MRWAGARTVAQRAHILICAMFLPLGHKLRRNRFGQTVDHPQAETQRNMLVEAAMILLPSPPRCS